MTELDFEAGNSKEYEIEAIRDSAIYARESEAWKGYPKEKNTWEPFSAVQHLKKLIRLFHKDHPEKLTATFPPINSALPMARPTIKPTRPTKQKQGQPANSPNKQAKKN